MCSIFFSTKKQGDLETINKFLKPRGPDSTNYDFRNGTFFIHNLLSITGAITTQPLFNEDDSIGMVFNGEIYNYKRFGDYDNDSKCIIPLYKKHGVNFLTGLDGEFAIIIVDYSKRIVILSTDIFGTKPLFYSNENGICAATYKHPITSNGFSNVKKMKANTVLVLDLDTGALKHVYELHKFDLNQHKTSPADWFTAFSRSIKKRTDGVTKKMFIGLSSGYDSGAIACELAKQKVPFSPFTIVGSENIPVLNNRYAILSQYLRQPVDVLGYTDSEFITKEAARKYIMEKTEEWKYTIYSSRSSYNEFNLSLWDDNGSISLSQLCDNATKCTFEGEENVNGRNKMKILISGAGADEIFSDYGWNGVSKYQHSNFGGLFPKDLKSIFPWPSFFGSSMESYLAKDEFVGGSYGLEVRYPFLDKDVVQEFLWLTADYKNSKYKSVLHDYLSGNHFPFAPNEKIGF